MGLQFEASARLTRLQQAIEDEQETSKTHEFGNNSMENDIVVIILSRQPNEILDRFRSEIWEQIDEHVSFRRVNDCASTERT